ncbi:MAG: glycosyltransferase [Phycisphaerae bacterium]
MEVTKILVGGHRLKYLKAIYGLIRHQKDHDLIFVAFRGHEILPVLRILSRKPIVFDAFVSVYDTLCFDRKIFSPTSLVGKFLKWYDKFLCGISDIVLVDTEAHKNYFEEEFEAHNVDYIYVGCNEELFKPMARGRDKSGFVVFWYGSANPLQGVDIILRSAKLLEDSGILFRLVGPIRKKYSALITDLQPQNIEFIDFIPYEELPAWINKSDICLGGHFSDREKSKRVIASKTFQFLACEKTTIVGDNPANRELFEEQGLAKFVKMNSPECLAEKILEVKENEK